MVAYLFGASVLLLMRIVHQVVTSLPRTIRTALHLHALHGLCCAFAFLHTSGDSIALNEM